MKSNLVVSYFPRYFVRPCSDFSLGVDSEFLVCLGVGNGFVVRLGVGSGSGICLGVANGTRVCLGVGNVLESVWLFTTSSSLSECCQCLGVCLGVDNILESVWVLTMSWSQSGCWQCLGFCRRLTINKQREIIALDRQATQQQRPQSPTVTPMSWSLTVDNVLESVWMLTMSWSLSGC